MDDLSKNSPAAPQGEMAALISERDQLRERVAALSSLMETSILINSTLDLDDLLRLVMQKAQSVMKAEASAVMIINEEKGVLECPVALGEVGECIKMIELPIDKGIAGWVATHREAQIVPDAHQDARFNPQIDAETGFSTRSILAAPLIVKERCIGVAEVINRIDGLPFCEEDLALFSTFCSQVAMAIENARIHQLELEKQRSEQQLESARVIQESFLVRECPSSPQGLFDVAATSEAAAAVGGDFYDFMEFDQQHIGIALGDVSGKGVPAALFMARMVSDVRLHARFAKDPAALMTRLNRIVAERSRRGMFVTAFYGILDPLGGVLRCANAGHLPLLWIHQAQQDVEMINEKTGIPLGITADYQYHFHQIQLAPGDGLVLLTDGIVEAKNRQGEPYSLNRVIKMLSGPILSADEQLNSLVDDVKSFCGDGKPHDDMTVVALRWYGNSELS